jgi:hypothetical protein
VREDLVEARDAVCTMIAALRCTLMLLERGHAADLADVKQAADSVANGARAVKMLIELHSAKEVDLDS